MDISEIPIDGYERVAVARDPASGLHAIIAVHDTTLGPSLGGIRMWPYPGQDEALRDVLRLAEGMTYKSAVAETGLGGGKSVIIGDSRRDKSDALFRSMGEFIESFAGSYNGAEDVGMSVADMATIRQTTQFVRGLPREAGGSGDPSPFTALGVFEGIKTCFEAAFGTADPKGRRVVVQGTGHVGGALARRLAEAGAELTLCDINREGAQSLANEIGAEVVEPGREFDVECDLFAPCALGAGINDETLPRFRCRVIAGAANNQLAEERHGQALKDAGILFAPDFVINGGGIINVGLEVVPGHYDEEFARKKVQAIGRVLGEVLDTARAKDLPTNEAALVLARSRIDAARAG